MRYKEAVKSLESVIAFIFCLITVNDSFASAIKLIKIFLTRLWIRYILIYFSSAGQIRTVGSRNFEVNKKQHEQRLGRNRCHLSIFYFSERHFT